jgi:serine/threonine protein kinase/tetratricopeptide (TPR) repeat protein
MKNVILPEGGGVLILIYLAVLVIVSIIVIQIKRRAEPGIFGFFFDKLQAKKNPAPLVAPSTQIIPRKCPQCGAELKPDVSEGLCPACLLQRGIATEGAPPGTPPFTPPTIPDLAKLFPQLEILELIGKGGMGAVYKARQPALDRFVALKILAPRSGGDLDFAARFTREARALAKLSHPNIVAVYDFGVAAGVPPAVELGVPPGGGTVDVSKIAGSSSAVPGGKMPPSTSGGTPDATKIHYFIMEHVDGPNLRQIEQAGKLPPREALEIIPQICAALQFAHDEGIVHRDIKPENILLDKKGRVKIADFGLAKILGQEPKDFRLTGARDVVGTPHYMAPEQIEKPQEVDHRADIYSLGVVFYEMLTGELPLGKFQPPSSRMGGIQIDVRLDEVVLHALEKDPARRYQHVSEVKTQLETIAATGSAGNPPAEPGDATGFFRPEAEQFGRDIARLLTKEGLLSFAKQKMIWFANQVLLFLDLTAKPQRFSFWLFLLLFCSNIGFLVSGENLAFALARRLLHGASHAFALSAQEHQTLLWMLYCGVGRLAALNLGSKDVAGNRRAQAAQDITTRRVFAVLRMWLLLAFLMAGGASIGILAGKLLIAATGTTTVQTNITPVVWWILICIAVGVILVIYVRVLARVWPAVKKANEESAQSKGLPAVETWLAMVDGGNYTQSWKTAAASFQRTISQEEWVHRLEKIRRPLGKVLSRKLSSTKIISGGTYWGAKFIFTTVFDGLPVATETVTFARQLNGEWKAIGYLIRPAGDDEKKTDRFWRRFAVVIACVILIPVAIAILGMLAASAIPNFIRARQHSREIAVRQWTQQGWQLWQEQKLDEAMTKFRQAVELDPDNANAWNGLGWATFNSGKSQEAEQAFQKAISLDTNQPGALNGLGQIYLSQRKYDLAEPYLLKAAPRATAAWHGLARLYLLEGKFDQAESWAQKLVDSGQADDLARQMRAAAQEKHLSEGLRFRIEPPPPKETGSTPAGSTATNLVPAATAVESAAENGQTVAGLPPVVVETQPVSGARDVEPGETEIRIRFSKEMADGGWSWSTAWENSTPETVGQIHYETDQRTCVLKAKLEPGRTYAWWLNSDKFKNFTDRAGRPAVPYLLIFQTKPN